MVYVRSRGVNQRGEMVVDYVRWVMVNKRDAAAPAPAEVVPDLPKTVPVAALKVPAGVTFDTEAYDTVLAGSPHLWDDYAPGEKIDHVDGMTIEEAEHMMATRLYQNTAKVHFNQFEQAKGRFGKRLIYGGHIISLARALSFNGLGNACKLGGDQRRKPLQPDLLRRYHSLLDRSAGQSRLPRTQRRRRPAPAHRRHQRPALRRSSV